MATAIPPQKVSCPHTPADAADPVINNKRCRSEDENDLDTKASSSAPGNVSHAPTLQALVFEVINVIFSLNTRRALSGLKSDDGGGQAAAVIPSTATSGQAEEAAAEEALEPPPPIPSNTSVLPDDLLSRVLIFIGTSTLGK